MSTRPRPRSNPHRTFAAGKASASALRPCAPTEQPHAPARTYRCPCGASVTLAPSEPLPTDWQTVVVPARKRAAERTGYRCGRCVRRALVMSLLSDDLMLRTVTRADARRLANWCEKAGLDDRGIRVVVMRLQSERAAASWDAIVDRATKGEDV